MSLFPVSQEYRSRWEKSKEPKLVHFTAVGEEASVHPRVMHSNEQYSELVLVLSGSGEYFIDGKLYPVQPGDLVVFNPGVAHDQRIAPGVAQTSYGLALTGFTFAGCQPNSLLPGECNPVLSCGDSFEAIRAIMQALQLYLAKALPGSEVVVHHLTQSLVAQVRALADQQPGEQAEQKNEIPLATRVREYLDENFCEDISLQSLSEKFNISSYYLAHIFKDQFGYPPLQYILRRRIGLAQTLLITTQYPVGEIGARVGYYNPSHFNLIFTKNVGISPRKYRMNYFH